MKILIRNTFIVLISLIVVQEASADLSGASKAYLQNKRSSKYYHQIIPELVDNGLYFSSVPLIKELIVSGRSRELKTIEKEVDTVIAYLGPKQFEVIPSKYLVKAKISSMYYILAKKYFRKGKYKKSLTYLNGTIPKDHFFKPFALQLEASISSVIGNHKSSIAAFKECFSKSEDAIGDEDDLLKLRQLEINRDYCLAGEARTLFAARKFEDAQSKYLDLPKQSYVWPEILFEEAWNSFYLEDFNRTLGKLVTYKAPIFNHIFNPEIEVLESLTYMELCLFADASKSVDDFYKKYEAEYMGLKSILQKHGRDYKYYYLLARSVSNGKRRGNNLLDKILRSIAFDPTYKEMANTFISGKTELAVIKGSGYRELQTILSYNLKESLTLQRNLIGSYVRNKLIENREKLTNALEGMSYIKLEVLNQRKAAIYNEKFSIGKRGKFENILMTDKQYFWNFNGEFWADELGDYVFSLKSQCKL